MSGLFGGASKATTHATRAMGIDFQGAQYGPVVPVVYGQNKVPGNCIWYGDFQSQSHQQKAGKGGGGGSTTNYTYSASAQMGLCEGPIGGLVNVFDGTSIVNLGSINYAFATGTKGQAAWSHLSGNQAIGYSLTAVFSFQNLALGSSASLPNYNYEIKGLKSFSASIVDANPADILTDVTSDPYHGINFPYLGTLTQYSNYCVANGLFISPVYDQQQSAQQTLSDLFKYTNAAPYYSDDQLKVVPLGDVAVTGNGVTYTPNVTPVVDLNDDDFLVNGSGDAPVQVSRTAPQDALNLVRVEFKDRTNTYHDSAVVASIDFDVVANGERSDNSETPNGITTGAVARFVAQNLVQRAFYIRNTYQFKLPWNYCYLEPTDIVTLTDASLGLTKYPVRITSIEEDGGSVLTIEAEEFPEGIGHSSIYGTQPNGGTNPDQNVDPGAVNAPFLFRGPGFLVSNNQPEIWCAVNGSNPLWAACDVYLSHDGTSYTYAGTIASQARYGSLTTALPAGTADPDITNTPTAQLYAPAALLGGSQADADNFVTLAMVDTEVIGYETATLTAANTYKLSYLRRGGYGSANVAHAIGAPFVRLDDSIFRIPVDPSLIGQTVYLKFLSLNAFGRSPRTLAEETAYTYVVGTNVELPDVPDVPVGFAVTPVADGVEITWTNDNPQAVGSTSIEYATASGGPFTVLAQVGPTTTAYHHGFTSGATYYYRARARGPLPQSGWSAYTAEISSTGKVVDPSGLNIALVSNPNFATGDLTGWRVEPGVTGWGAQNALASSPNPQIPTYVSYYLGSAANTALRNKSCNPCQAGDVVSATCQVACASGGGSGYIRIIFYNSASQELAGGGTGNSFTGNGTGTSRATATAPAGSVYFVVAPAIVGYTTGVFRFTAFAVSLGARSLDEVPDGTTYGRTATNYLSNNRAIVDFNDTFHRNKTQDYIPAGATWGATRLSALQNGVPQWATSGKNLAPNASFASNKVGTPAGNLASGAPISDGWAVSANPAGFYVAYEQNAGGVSDVEIQLNGGTVVPANGSVTAFVQTVSPVPVKAGAPYAVTGTRGCQSNVALPAGITVASRIYAQFLFADGSSAGYSPLNEIDGNAYAPTAQTVVGTVPANAVSAIIGLQMYVTNGTASAITVGASGQIPAGIRWYNAQFVESVNLDYEAVDGTTHGRIAMQDVFQVSGVNRSGLRVPGSGYTVGDQRNLLPVTWAGVRSVNSTSPITYTYTWNAAAGLYNISVNVAAYTLYGGDFSLNYAASSLSGTQAASTTVSAYYYYLDPTSSGGSLALHYATDPAVLAQQNGVVFIGSASLTTPAPASAPGGGAGGGGGGFCVADDMFIGDGRLAGDADIGDPFDCIDLPTAAGKHVRALQGFTRGVEECVRMITSDGCALVCSVSTPFDLPDGRSTTAPHMLGEQVITDLGTATVVSLALVGPKPVTRAHLGGVSYAAGADPQRRIYSHNAGTSKP